MPDEPEDEPLQALTIEFVNGPLGKGTLTIPMPAAHLIPDVIEVTFGRHDVWQDEDGKWFSMIREPVVARYEFDQSQNQATATNRYRVVRHASGSGS